MRAAIGKKKENNTAANVNQAQKYPTSAANGRAK
jgi:hypothetical protein